MTAPILKVEGLTAGYQPGLPIIRDVTMHVTTGELVTIIGPNGAGKSTLIKAVAGLLHVEGGKVELAGSDITRIDTHRMADAALAYVPQTDNIFASLTVDENLRLGAQALSKATARERVEEAYQKFPDLRRFAKKKAGVLSGGQRQMLAVGRALLTHPEIVMLDEPSAGLSPKMVDDVFAQLVALRAAGVSILMVEQNAKAAMRISDRTYVLAEGENRLDGPSAALLEDPEVTQIYLGRAGRKQ
ncbi:ABC transporter ATP-binding protein [Psychromarinibacter halotolerans]|uniref:ABC transporter ATP-binding protein n=1 Tax=Psychromarinibacter halotolerans TaxID=1775175 RepID=A0ABV7GVC5_9RHOB|nr:ABC transporter ATP-binding protein [Psychromarinibacter halotolerans]MDF0595225.1 ABC transporter ATP-binding protein [Psychromarinibacter halotolerans]